MDEIQILRFKFEVSRFKVRDKRGLDGLGMVIGARASARFNAAGSRVVELAPGASFSSDGEAA